MIMANWSNFKALPWAGSGQAIQSQLGCFEQFARQIAHIWQALIPVHWCPEEPLELSWSPGTRVPVFNIPNNLGLP